MTEITPDNISVLQPGQIFVFGSNTQGRHGKGAALTARRLFGAQSGCGMGRTGQCYAIATKDAQLRTLPLEDIGIQIVRFINYAEDHPELRFLVTEIGCGLAGYTPRQIAPLFLCLPLPHNISLPKRFMAHD